MHDINTIAKLNARAVEEHISKEQAAGKWAVAEYIGLHFVSHFVFSTEAEARRKADEIDKKLGCRATVFPPTNIN